MNVLLGVLSVLCLSLALLFRNNGVFKLRMKFLEEEGLFIRQDIMNRWKGSYLRMDTMPSYERMFLTFWKPLSHYAKEYPLTRFYKVEKR